MDRSIGRRFLVAVVGLFVCVAGSDIARGQSYWCHQADGCSEWWNIFSVHLTRSKDVVIKYPNVQFDRPHNVFFGKVYDVEEERTLALRSSIFTDESGAEYESASPFVAVQSITLDRSPNKEGENKGPEYSIRIINWAVAKKGPLVERELYIFSGHAKGRRHVAEEVAKVEKEDVEKGAVDRIQTEDIEKWKIIGTISKKRADGKGGPAGGAAAEPGLHVSGELSGALKTEITKFHIVGWYSPPPPNCPPPELIDKEALEGKGGAVEKEPAPGRQAMTGAKGKLGGGVAVLQGGGKSITAASNQFAKEGQKGLATTECKEDEEVCVWIGRALSLSEKKERESRAYSPPKAPTETDKGEVDKSKGEVEKTKGDRSAALAMFAATRDKLSLGLESLPRQPHKYSRIAVGIISASDRFSAEPDVAVLDLPKTPLLSRSCGVVRHEPARKLELVRQGAQYKAPASPRVPIHE